MNERTREEKFSALLQEHGALLLKVARLYMFRAEDRRDLVQEICLQAWRSFSSFDPLKAKFTTWLYRVALNVAVSSLRKSGIALEANMEPLAEEHLAGISAESVAEPDERLEALYVRVRQLDGLNRALILLYLEDKSYAEMAEIMGISQTNVSTKINRIKLVLREQMAGVSAQKE